MKASGRGARLCVAALGSCAIYGGVVHAFAPPSRTVCPARSSTLQLGSSPEPLATEGDWSAYVDGETTGYVYYFNSVTGESSWDPPSATFPAVAAPSAAEDATREQRKEQRRLERKQAREQKKRERDEKRKEREAKEAEEREARKLEQAEKAVEPVVADASERQTKKKSSGGGFFGLFAKGGSDKTDDGKPKKTKLETLNELSDMATNDGFLSELDAVIAEGKVFTQPLYEKGSPHRSPHMARLRVNHSTAEGRFSFDHCMKISRLTVPSIIHNRVHTTVTEAIAIADKITEAPAKNKGGFFTSTSFVSGEEATSEAEELIADAEERTSNIFSQFTGGAKASPKAEKKEEIIEEPEPEENVWAEGLKNLFTNTFNSFIPPETTTNKTTKKVVAKEETPTRKKKATVSDSDYLDAVWGAETSARPTLNIAEMMKAFQVESKEEEKKVEEVSDEFRTLSLDVALQVKAHPEKVSWGGEDAGFSVGRTFGVFDGVSGATKEKGKKLYSRSLADSMKKKSGKSGLSIKELTSYMLEAKELADEEATGASTAVVASIGEDNVLRALNLGDSVCLVLRDGESCVCFASTISMRRCIMLKPICK